MKLLTDTYSAISEEAKAEFASMVAKKLERGFDYGHLYVMQARSGPIKIGRSADPEKRRRSLQVQIGEPVALIAVLDQRGVEEECIHVLLRRSMCHLVYEWFDSHRIARDIIGRLLGVADDVWIFGYSGEKTTLFRAKIELASAEKSKLRFRREVLGNLRRGYVDARTNGMILLATRTFITVFYNVSDSTSSYVELGRNSVETPTPHFLSSYLEAASAGPPGWRAPSDITTIEVLILALEAWSVYESPEKKKVPINANSISNLETKKRRKYPKGTPLSAMSEEDRALCRLKDRIKYERRRSKRIIGLLQTS
jgi:hypothetical protein